MQMIDFKIDIFAKGEGFATYIFSCFGVCITLFLLQSLSKDMGIDNERDIYFDHIGGLLMAIRLVITVGIYLFLILRINNRISMLSFFYLPKFCVQSYIWIFQRDKVIIER